MHKRNSEPSVVAEIAFCIQKFFRSIQKDRRIQIEKNLLYTKNIFCIQKIYFVYKKYFSYIEKHVLYLITFLKNLFVYLLSKLGRLKLLVG